MQPLTYAVRDPRYGLGEVEFEYVYKPVYDFTGDWTDPFGNVVSFGPTTQPGYDVQGAHAPLETVFLASDSSQGGYAVKVLVVTSLGGKEHLVTYRPNKKDS